MPGSLQFEFDERKSLSNSGKHGIDFVRAQELWQDEDLLEMQARVTGEPRYVVVGRIGGRHWTAVITYRGDAIRIISVRRSRALEVQAYEGT